MTGVRMSHEDRFNAIVAAARELIEQGGVSAVTLTAIALRSGVSRQWLYEFFPDINSVFAFVYAEGRRDHFHEDRAPEHAGESLRDYLMRRAAIYLDLPVASAIIGVHALNGGLKKSASDLSLRDSIYANLQAVWVEPMVERGFARDDLFASIVSVVNVIFGLVIAIDNGYTTREVAERRLSVTIEAVMLGPLT
jgi:AcrR family transcriptional regulator